jgi:NAD(P)-dependent dehydrogenase (short-subunit alcohol dehydrogenase family)
MNSIRAWTTADMPAQGGRLAVVTGTTRGIGHVVARELARGGATVVMPVRDLDRGQRAADDVRAVVPGARLEVTHLDLASLASVRAFAQSLLVAHEAPDLVIACAGIMAVAPGLSEDGFDLQLAVNYLGHFALAGLLVEGMLERPGARIVAVSSINHWMGELDLEDVAQRCRYRPWQAYNRSKLANLSWAFELDRRLRAAQAAASSVAAHPGYTATQLQRRIAPPVSRTVFTLTNRVLAQSPEMGALPLLYAATAPRVAGGAYIGPSGVGELRGHPASARAKRAARDQTLAAALWRRSEELSGIRYPGRLSPAGHSDGEG